MPTSERGDAKRQAMLDAATEVFSERGFVGANLDEVVATAAVSKQTLYKHFSDKASLFREIVDQIGLQVDGALLELPDPATIESIDEWIHTLALRFMRQVMDPKVQRVRRLVIAEAPRFPDVADAYWKGGFDRVLGTVSAHFRGLTEAGKLNAPDPELAANHFAGLLLWIPSNQTMFSGRPDVVSDEELQRYAKAGADAFLRAYRWE